LNVSDSATDVLNHWNFESPDVPGGVLSIKDGVLLVNMSSAKKYVLKRRVSLQNLEREYPLLSSLAEQGVPVAVPIVTRDGNRNAKYGDDCFCLYPFLEGATLFDHLEGSMEQRAMLSGGAIGRLHVALRGVSGIDMPGEMNLLEHVLGWAKPIVEKDCSLGDSKRLLEVFHDWESRMTSVYDDLPKQLIHRDAHPRNMLFQQGTLSGFLDFDLMLVSVRLFDPCGRSISSPISRLNLCRKASKHWRSELRFASFPT